MPHTIFTRMTIQQYLQQLQQRYGLGNATEHTFRGNLQQLLEALLPNVIVTNEPRRQSCGAPDYILTRRRTHLPLGYIEAKNINDPDLTGANPKGNKEQLDRYKRSLNNLIVTDYLRFHWYVDGQQVATVSIGECTAKGIVALPQHFEQFEHLIKEFYNQANPHIDSSKVLAQMMANKARLMANMMENALNQDISQGIESTLSDQLAAFETILIPELKPKEFADLYAQTVAYGLFAARLHDPTADTFSRQEAAELIPKSNPFLRKLFQYIAGPDIDDRIQWVVDGLIEVFLACNVQSILNQYQHDQWAEDPIIHFYETFLSEYDPALRKARGVWYTPQPVVQFMVTALHHVLQQHFDLPKGIADHSHISLPHSHQSTHRVQILDPATGTGTFLAQIIKQVHQQMQHQQGTWTHYCQQHLLPRLHGFELLMASYAMAHLQLDRLLSTTQYQPTKQQRLNVFLTNSLEESKNAQTVMPFARWLTDEANAAHHVKTHTPIMCIIGNPPYSGESANKSDWIMHLMEDYKKEPNSRQKLQEKNPKWINDDYVKFLRMGEHFIHKNHSGVLVFINPHGFLDNPTFRGMRWHLLQTYDTIYTIDLHGNAKKKETAPDGSPDQNVFDIMQGVSINIMVKTAKKPPQQLATVLHADLYGKREHKYQFLQQHSLSTIPFQTLQPTAPNYFMVPKNADLNAQYQQGLAVNELFKLHGTGIVSKRDKLAFQDTKKDIVRVVEDIYNLSPEAIKQKYSNISWDSRDGKVEFCKTNVMQYGLKDSLFIKCSYRPFDTKWTYYTGVSKGFIGWPVKHIMQHFLRGDNVGLVTVRRIKTGNNLGVFVSNKISDDALSGMSSSVICPLYLYPVDNSNEGQQSISNHHHSGSGRVANLNEALVQRIAHAIGWQYVHEASSSPHSFAPIDVFDYVYAVLHSPAYRAKYAELLKSDFPRVPLPPNVEVFAGLVDLGSRLRQLHLLSSPLVQQFITHYPIAGSNTIDNPYYQATAPHPITGAAQGRVYLNDAQYFDQVPLVAWSFYIGGYQPAQKWLKDRKHQTLNFDDIEHYQQMIVSLTQSYYIMQQIDEQMPTS